MGVSWKLASPPCPVCNIKLFPHRFGDYYTCINSSCKIFTKKFSSIADVIIYKQTLIPPPKTKRSSMKELRIKKLFNDTIVELHFIARPKRGWFSENIKPMVDFIKIAVPASAREYNPDNFKWHIGIEYWPVLEKTFKLAGWSINELAPDASTIPHIDVPEDYKENFYNSPIVETVEPLKEVEEKLTLLLELGDPISVYEEIDLKKQYRKMARKYHPDLGGDATKMSELNRLWTLYTNATINSISTGA